jgi:hypothetical protein
LASSNNKRTLVVSSLADGSKHSKLSVFPTWAFNSKAAPSNRSVQMIFLIKQTMVVPLIIQINPFKLARDSCFSMIFTFSGISCFYGIGYTSGNIIFTVSFKPAF